MSSQVPPPLPHQWNKPGVHNDPERLKKAPPDPAPEEELEELKRREPEAEEGAPPRDPFEGPPIVPRKKQEAVDPYQPVKELGMEVTFHVVIPDNRPVLTVPLSGPGAYRITVERRQ